MPRREHLRVGKARECIVAADFFLRGFEVYEGDGRSSCDLVIRKENGPFRGVEVKPYDIHHGRFGPVTWNNKARNAARFDVLAMVLENRTVLYRRSINLDPNDFTKELWGDNDQFNKRTTHAIQRRGAASETET